jgi:hypothetical protein
MEENQVINKMLVSGRFSWCCHSNWSLVEIDTSTEWNKVGVVSCVKKGYAEAERVFIRAKKKILQTQTLIRTGGNFNKTG